MEILQRPERRKMTFSFHLCGLPLSDDEPLSSDSRNSLRLFPIGMQVLLFRIRAVEETLDTSRTEIENAEKPLILGDLHSMGLNV